MWNKIFHSNKFFGVGCQPLNLVLANKTLANTQVQACKLLVLVGLFSFATVNSHHHMKEYAGDEIDGPCQLIPSHSIFNKASPVKKTFQVSPDQKKIQKIVNK